MAATPAEIALIHGRVERLRRYSDRLVGIGPFGIGLDGMLAWVPVAGAIYTVSAGGWLIAQALRGGASPGTIARMLAYLGVDTAASSVPVPLVASAVDFLFPGHLMAARALLKDIEGRHPHLKPLSKKALRLKGRR